MSACWSVVGSLSVGCLVVVAGLLVGFTPVVVYLFVGWLVGCWLVCAWHPKVSPGLMFGCPLGCWGASCCLLVVGWPRVVVVWWSLVVRLLFGCCAVVARLLFGPCAVVVWRLVGRRQVVAWLLVGC